MSAEHLLALGIAGAVMSVYTFSKKDYGAMGVFMFLSFFSLFGWFLAVLQ